MWMSYDPVPEVPFSSQPPTWSSSGIPNPQVILFVRTGYLLGSQKQLEKLGTCKLVSWILPFAYNVVSVVLQKGEKREVEGLAGPGRSPLLRKESLWAYPCITRRQCSLQQIGKVW